ncbi:DUF943 family protein [Enterobacteriaceae bacterium LUAb1]
MKIRNKQVISVLLLAGGITVSYFLWLFIRPVEIVSVHQRNNYSDVLVNAFPITDQGKINWWLKNKAMLKRKFNIPKPATYGNFTITVWDFGDGYKKQQEKYDRVCFDDMKADVNCIEKNAIFIISNDRDNRIYFTVDNRRYMLQKEGKVIKLKNW